MKNLLGLMVVSLVGCIATAPSGKGNSDHFCASTSTWVYDCKGSPCLKVVEGKAHIDILQTAGSCPITMSAMIRDTYATGDESSRMKLTTGKYRQLVLRDIDLAAGESLFISAENGQADISCCYIEWKGMRQK